LRAQFDPPRRTFTTGNLSTRFLRNRAGATAIEYGLFAALVALAIVAGTTSLGTSLGNAFDSIATTLTNDIAPSI